MTSFPLVFPQLFRRRAMRLFSLFALVLLALGCIGCPRAKAPPKIKVYADHGIRFEYPDNFRAEPAKKQNFGWNLTFHGPHDSVFILLVVEPGWNLGLEPFAKAFGENISQESSQIGKILDVKTKPGTPVRPGEAVIDCEYTVKVLIVPVPHVANIWSQKHGELNVIGVTQCSNENRPLIAATFNQLRTSLGPQTPGGATGAAPGKPALQPEAQSGK